MMEKPWHLYRCEVGSLSKSDQLVYQLTDDPGARKVCKHQPRQTICSHTPSVQRSSHSSCSSNCSYNMHVILVNALIVSGLIYKECVYCLAAEC